MPANAIASWQGSPYSSKLSPLGILHDAHFKTFNAAEAETSQRARGRYLNGLRVLESAFYSIASELDADEWDAEWSKQL